MCDSIASRNKLYGRGTQKWMMPGSILRNLLKDDNSTWRRGIDTSILFAAAGIIGRPSACTRNHLFSSCYFDLDFKKKLSGGQTEYECPGCHKILPVAGLTVDHNPSLVSRFNDNPDYISREDREILFYAERLQLMCRSCNSSKGAYDGNSREEYDPYHATAVELWELFTANLNSMGSADLNACVELLENYSWEMLSGNDLIVALYEL